MKSHQITLISTNKNKFVDACKALNIKFVDVANVHSSSKHAIGISANEFVNGKREFTVTIVTR